MFALRKARHLILLGISYKLKLLKPPCPPYQYLIEATNRCNFKCVFCPQSDPEHKNTREYGFLTPQKFQIFSEKIRDAKPGSSNISICLDGEPLMNKSFVDFIRIANQADLFPRFSSNGKLLTPAMADELVKCGRFLAAIDFSSEAEIFDTIRGGKGDYDVVLNNLKYLVDIAIHNPEIKLEIVDISSFSGADPELSLSKMRAMFPSDLPGNIAFWSREFHNFLGHVELEAKGSRYKLCPYPWSSFTVTWDGDVVPCCRDTEAKTVLGNVFDQSIHDIWHGERYVEVRENLINRQPEKVKACAKCDMPWSGGEARWRLSYMVSSLLRR